MPSDASFWDHIEQLRHSCLKALAVIAIGFCCCFACYPQVYQVLKLPLGKFNTQTPGYAINKLDHQRITNIGTEPREYLLPQNAVVIGQSDGVFVIDHHQLNIPPGGHISIEIPQVPHQLTLLGPLDGMMTTLKVCFWSGITLTAPAWLLIVMTFIMPGLKGEERRLIPFWITGAVAALAAGIVFGLTVIIPITNRYLYAFNSVIGYNLWTVSQYLSYTVILLAANVLAFEFAVVITFLVHTERLQAEAMARHRRVVIVAIFIAAAILTPPDVVSQIALGLPLVIFYEGAIVYARLRQKKQHRVIATH